MGACVMDSNEFLISILDKFGLQAFYTDDNFEHDFYKDKENQAESVAGKKLEYLILMSEYFLELLIHVLSER